MVTAKIEIEAKFGSKFQEKFARDALMGLLKAWENYLMTSHGKNELSVFVNGDDINYFNSFNWKKQLTGKPKK